MDALQNVTAQLPDTLEDLTQFVLVGKAKLDAYMLKLRTVNRLSTAQEIRNQTLKEAQEIATALIASEQRIGEILLEIPTRQGGDRKSEDFKRGDASPYEKTKTETIKDMGYSRDEAKDYQTMARNPEIVNRVIQDAISKGEVVTKTQVMKEIRAARESARQEAEQAARQEAEKLQAKVEELEARGPEIVMPEDYEKVKRDLERQSQQLERVEKERFEYCEELREAKKKLREYEGRTSVGEMQKQLEDEAGYFAIRTYNYIQKNGGSVWITEKLMDLPEGKRKEFVASIYAIDAFAKQMIENIGGYGIE